MLIFGGAYRKSELVQLTTKDVIDSGEFILIDIKNIKNKKPRQFAITTVCLNNSNLLLIVRKYMALRDKKMVHDRFSRDTATECARNSRLELIRFLQFQKKLQHFCN